MRFTPCSTRLSKWWDLQRGWEDLNSTRPLDRTSRPSRCSTRSEVDFVTRRNLVVMGSKSNNQKILKFKMVVRSLMSKDCCSDGVRRSCVDERLIVSDSQLSWGPGYDIISNYTTTVYHQNDQHFCVKYRQETSGFCTMCPSVMDLVKYLLVIINILYFC